MRSLVVVRDLCVADLAVADPPAGTWPEGTVNPRNGVEPGVEPEPERVPASQMSGGEVEVPADEVGSEVAVLWPGT